MAAPSDRRVRVGLAITYPPGDWTIGARGVVDGLRDFGYVPGRNLELIERFVRFPQRPDMAELLAQQPEVIVTGCGRSTSAAITATRTVPIVMVAATDPVGRGWITSLARPGSNVTGVASMLADLPAKILDHMRLVLPKLERVGVGLDLRGEASGNILPTLTAAAHALDLRIVAIDANTFIGPQAIREALRRSGVQALIGVPADHLFFASFDPIVEAATELGIAVATFRSDFLGAGALLSYGASPERLFRRTAFYVDRIVSGAHPSDLPVELPSVWEFAINLKQAAALGINVPRAVLLRADKVIQ